MRLLNRSTLRLGRPCVDAQLGPAIGGTFGAEWIHSGVDAAACTPMTLTDHPHRRRWIAATSAALLALAARPAASSGARGIAGAATSVRRLCTFGDSVLDSARYNDRGLDAGQLLVRNDDRLFPEFSGRDLSTRGECRLEHRAVDGATSAGLAAQARGFAPADGSIAIVSVGGNDLLRGLSADTGPGLRAFEATVDDFLKKLAVRPVLVATVYDPTFGDDARNFLGVPAATARANHRRVNAILAALGARYGRTVDLHEHFLHGDPGWFTRTIEPSLVGASEIRRAFLAAIDGL
jgi:acyl-CoA thioesterase-1